MTSEDDKPQVQKAVEGIDLVRGILGAKNESPPPTPSSEKLPSDTNPGCGCIALGGVLALLTFVLAVLWLRSDDDKTPTKTSVATTSSTTRALNGAAQPPDPASLAPGTILFKGSTTANIGSIASDGLIRFTEINGPGFAAGNPDGAKIALVWKQPGRVISFGSNLHTNVNKGRYGVSLYRIAAAKTPAAGDSPYRPS